MAYCGVKMVLNHTQWYKGISPLMVDIFNKEYYSLVDNAFRDSIINQTVCEYIRTLHPRTPTFCSLPKTNKKGQIITGCSIVLGSGNLTECGRVSWLMQPYARTYKNFFVCKGHYQLFVNY